MANSILCINFITIKEKKREREIDTKTQRDIDRQRGESDGERKQDRRKETERIRKSQPKETRALFVPWTIRQRR